MLYKYAHLKTILKYTFNKRKNLNMVLEYLSHDGTCDFGVWHMCFVDTPYKHRDLLIILLIKTAIY